MGNSISNGDYDEEREFRNMDESSSENEDLNDKDSQVLTDLDNLFKHADLRTIAAKIKEDIPENVIQQHRYQIIRWLDDREAKSEETVTLAQFCDMLMNKPGVSREDAIRAFQQFDTDGSGVVEVSTILSAIKYSNGPNMIGELGKSIRMLQACSLTPGFVDVYSEDKNAVSQHAERILKYLLRNRAPSHSLPFPHLNGFNNTSSMRLSVLKNTFNQLKDAARGELAETSLSDGEEVKLLNPCFSSIEVTSNNSDAHRLTNGLTHTFWQSDGAARSHFIRLHFRNNVVVKLLSMNVASADSSYMPEHVTITAGRNAHSLREIKDIRIPSSLTGDVVLLKNAKCHYPIIQINIKRCRNDGCDTRIHGIKAIGYKVVKESGISVSDSAAVWFLQVLASTVTASIPLAPALQKNIIEHSKNALEHIPPMTLSPACSDKPPFLTKLVLQEVEKFITDVAV
ncbi:zinc finger ZZ-type and EF-hand domain-containing protein 1-like [Ruditapes philippinarum]|uniref:zinc finger ZZ-type and EF-hand domain-containing protein 1-like n=1 Tax=Ruditapes philippinarum TaxID=129788 RepID=UPI00295B68E6|nr:zinc finger ZZ-type and EF-hand domain-containing protein 1-like [Ruditapes philippinarum]